MNKLKYILLYLIFIFFVSCKTTSKVEKISEVKSDTLYNKVETIIRPPLLNNLTIFDICDTLTGKPKEFKYKYVIEKDTFEISLLNNELNLAIQQQKELKSKNDSLVRIINSEKNQSSEGKIIEYRIPKWVWYVLTGFIAYIIILHNFPKIIPKINSLLRKLIFKI